MDSVMNGMYGAATLQSVVSTVYSVPNAAFLSPVHSLPQKRCLLRRTYQLDSSSTND